MATLYGVAPSPFVRKVQVLMAEKNLSCEFVTIMPFAKNPDYRKISPLGKVPCYQDEEITLADSSAICAYLEKKFPEPALYPTDPAGYGKALWFEEYADSEIAQCLVGKVFFQKMIAPILPDRAPDPALIEEGLNDDLPRIAEYLENELSDNDYLVNNQFSIADISIASGFVNAILAGANIDPQQWPRLSAYIERLHSRPSFVKAIAEVKQFLKLD